MSDPSLIAQLPDTLNVLPKLSNNQKYPQAEPSILSAREQRELYEAIQELQKNQLLIIQALKAGS